MFQSVSQIHREAANEPAGLLLGIGTPSGRARGRFQLAGDPRWARNEGDEIASQRPVVETHRAEDVRRT